jgi:membrane associated rhomboid family serine protease
VDKKLMLGTVVDTSLAQSTNSNGSIPLPSQIFPEAAEMLLSKTSKFTLFFFTAIIILISLASILLYPLLFCYVVATASGTLFGLWSSWDSFVEGICNINQTFILHTLVIFLFILMIVLLGNLLHSSSTELDISQFLAICGQVLGAVYLLISGWKSFIDQIQRTKSL